MAMVTVFATEETASSLLYCASLSSRHATKSVKGANTVNRGAFRRYNRVDLGHLIHYLGVNPQLLKMLQKYELSCNGPRSVLSTPCLKKPGKIIFVITSSNFHQPWQVLAQRWQRVQNYMRCTHFPPHLIYVTALPCKTQMFKIVKDNTVIIGCRFLTFAHICVISSTDGATWFNEVVVFSIMNAGTFALKNFRSRERKQ